jgi:hypothetical protein
MKRVISPILLGVGALVLFAGCSNVLQPQPKPQPKVIEKVIIKEPTKEDIAKAMEKEKLKDYKTLPTKEFVVYGEGIAPSNTISPAQALALAKRAAVTDAYRQLGEKLYGIRVNAKETVKDAALKDSRIVTQVNGLIKNATITDTSYKDGLYRVRMELTMNGERWKEIFSY